ncbi:single-stranded-DNA-specific exonuclease RecJ [Longimonas halophila]|uniref:Single-stranded-DNA-specific exonuclease RecJ n=1 Tax=Longimonas halophila TaxID=1469170 RepID=A0A2H3NMD4_9BACT|nr:single-stranded-DNA-specific exonuclease RecJ [Longimonas halophila]PEN05796.1 single-stranded-DNA-specific exonuclease RecJ [Longimonas halophila]
MTYRWMLRTLDDPGVVAQLQPRLNDLPTALTRALALRDVNSFEAARDFFRASRSDLHNPLDMADMPRAAERVAAAIADGETVLVYGDYDVDGTTATAMCTHFLHQQDVPASFFIPDRYEDGYGLCKRGIDAAVERGASLIIALDCGITAHAEADYAREQGLDLIICDHHTPKDTLPNAYAVLDPKRDDCAYPFTELSGAGVGFKLLQATQRVRGASEDRVFDYLDLLGISIASDIVPMYGENRILMQEGLAALQSTERVGLRALAKAADLDLTSVKTTGNIVFTIGPRINAAGRMAHARKAVDLMLESDPATARDQAEELEQLNKERRSLDERIRKEATKQAERQITARTAHALVLYDPDWHLGVIGIVASRIVEQFYKPTIMLTRNGDAVKGSARSISGVNIYRALTDCEDVLTQFGGHDYAAGMSLPEANVSKLRDRFNEAIAERITPELLTPTIKVDAHVDLETIGTADGRFWAVLQQFGPFGPSNPRPVFHLGPCRVAKSPRTVGRDDAHLKFTVAPADTDAPQIDVIGFGQGDKLDLLRESRRSGTPIELVAKVDENTWRGQTSIQLKLRDVRLYDGDSSLRAASAQAAAQ